MLFLGSFGLLAQTAVNTSLDSDVPASTRWLVVERGANHRIWQWETYEKAPDGRAVPHVHQVVELAAGMHYKDANGQWQESQELIESYPGGAIARQGQHQVIFANNINSFGAIDMQTPDGKRLKSNLLGLMYYDASTGDAVMIAELQDSTGEMIADNRVLYPNAFNGLLADVQYTYTRGGFEQDVILREQPPAPELFGMNPDTTELEVFTEFINPPKANVRSDSQQSEDQTVSWGVVSLGRGKAFNVGGQDQVGVSKRYVTIQGRHFLLEKVSMKRIGKDLSKLPEQAGLQRKLPYLASKTPYLPPQRQIVTAQPKMKLAKVNRSAELGYVLDYVTLNASYTNYTFQGDSTYYISGAINLCGTNTFEGGAVIKYATNAAITLVSTPLTPGIVFKTGAYRPTIFTAKDDNTAGESISGSTGNPSGYYANPAVNLQSMGDQTLHDFRISYAAKGLSVSGASPYIYDAQFVKCSVGLSDINGDVALGNVLFTGTKTNFMAASAVNVIEAQQVTFNNAFDLIGGSYANTTINLTNCLLVNVTNMAGTINAGYNGFFQTVPMGGAAVTNTFNPFQVVGAGSCYLTNGCAFLDAGTTNLDAAVWDLIRTKTTCPPLVYSNTTLSGITNFSPLVARDTDVPDLGYHYDPLDYAFGGAKATTNLVATAGTAFGWFELTGANNYALSLPNYCSLTYNGTAVSPCVFARYSTVQEGGNGLWTAKGTLGGVVSKGTVSANTNYASQVIATFTHFASVAGGPSHCRDATSDFILRASHCEFTANQMGGYNIQIFLTNCLLDATYVGAMSSSSWQSGISMNNCTMREFYMAANHWSGSVWPVHIVNTIFEKTALNQVDVSSPGDTNITYCDFNAFMTNATRLPVFGVHDVTNIISYNWQGSWLGDYYLSMNSPLINAGSTTADQLMLYHFTTQTNQIKEANSIIDIGYHYVATDEYGHPMDTDGDNTADYLEDVNGNGIYDGGDSDNWLRNLYNGLSASDGLRVFTPLK